MILKIKINAAPLSLNNVYSTSRSGRRFLTAKGKTFKELIKHATKRAQTAQGFVFNKNLEYLSSEVFYYTPKLFTLSGKINQKKPDTSNCFKVLEDAIFETLGIDDCYNLDVDACMRFSKEPIIIVILRTHPISSLGLVVDIDDSSQDD